MNRDFRICGVWEGEGKEYGAKKKLFEEIMGKNFSDLVKETYRFKKLSEPQIK